MGVHISEDIIHKAGMSNEEFLLELAIWLFSQERLTMGQASKLANLSQFEFQQELGKRKISLHYGIKELHEDLTHLGISIEEKR